MLTAKKSLKQKNSEKIVFFIFFASGLPSTMMPFFTYSAKIYKKSENAGHMRPGPWKSCHPREGK
jgi:hypothetical protein